MRIIIGITTTPNRQDYLKILLESFTKYHNPDYHYEIIIHNDVNKEGVHVGTNRILKTATGIDFDFGFKMDDDVFFLKSGWEDIYINFSKQTGYGHLCYKNADWNNHNSGTTVYHAMGCFWTFTPEVLRKVGGFDTANMGYRGIGHIDYSARCCRAGFNNEGNFLDAPKSNKYIGMHFGSDYKSSLTQDEIMKHRKGQADKMRIAKDKSRIFIPL